MKCLIFTTDAIETAEPMTLLLQKQSISVAVSATEFECIELLDQGIWPLLVIDASGENAGRLDVLSQCKASQPDIAALVLVSRGDIRTTVRAMKAGATDCIEKPIDKTQFLTALAALCGQASDHPCDALLTLTKTEQLVLQHILDGQTSPEIAEKLCRSPRTIDVHRRNIMKKMNVDGLVGLVRQTLGRV